MAAEIATRKGGYCDDGAGETCRRKCILEKANKEGRPDIAALSLRLLLNVAGQACFATGAIDVRNHVRNRQPRNLDEKGLG